MLQGTSFYFDRVLKGDICNPLVDAVKPKGIREQRKQDESTHLIQKNQPSMIIRLTNLCAQICSYCLCTENDKPDIMEHAQITEVFKRIGNDTSVREIVLSGGDPLFVKPATLEFVAKSIAEANRMREKPLLVALSTRLPVVAPNLLEGARMDALIKLNPAHLDIHILHPDEITPEFVSVCNRLNASVPGISIKTVHPLLHGINDSAEVLSMLYLRLDSEARVRPRDLIMPMPGATPEQLMVSLESGMRIMRELKKTLPGKLVPTLTVFSPDQDAKNSDVDPFHMKKDGTFGFDIENGFISGLFFNDGSGLQPRGACKM
jgi:lysine 2,3-aminomutase